MAGKIRWMLAAAMACLAASAAIGAPNGKLTIGEPAPMIQVKEFVKGAPVTGFEKGKLYVVEFWATWCGPCKMSIPHLTEMQKKYPQIKFVGVSVWEQDQAKVKPFVQEMGSKMAYCVAMDVVPAGKTGNDGVMAKTWMQAAGQNGIPTAFIVNKESRVAWIGHPMVIDQPLAKVAAGQWDISAARAEFDREQAQQEKQMELSRKLGAARKSGDPKQVLAVIDQAIAADPAMEMNLGMMKLSALSGDPEKAESYGTHLLNDVYKDNANALNGLAWTLVDPAHPKPDAKLAALALRAAKRADEIEAGKDKSMSAAIADTLGRAYFVNGDVPAALAAQERAIQLAKGTDMEKDPDIPKRLEEYRKAAGK